MPQFYDGPIFEHDDDEKQEVPRNTLERTFSPLRDPYDVISKAIHDHMLITFPKETSY